MKQLIERLVSETPYFFKVIRNGALGLATLGGAIIVAHSQMPDLPIPMYIQMAAKYFVFCGLVAAAVAQTTKR